MLKLNKWTCLFLFFCLMVVVIGTDVYASESLSCSNKRYGVRLSIGSDGKSFSGTLTVESHNDKTEGGRQQYSFSSQGLRIAYFDGKKEIIQLYQPESKKGALETPSFMLEAHGTSGFLEIQGKKWPVGCDWR